MSEWAVYNGVLFVGTRKCGIDPLLTIINGIELYNFPDDKRHYHKAEDCLVWFRDELEYLREHDGPEKEISRCVDNIRILEKNIVQARETKG